MLQKIGLVFFVVAVAAACVPFFQPYRPVAAGIGVDVDVDEDTGDGSAATAYEFTATRGRCYVQSILFTTDTASNTAALTVALESDASSVIYQVDAGMGSSVEYYKYDAPGNGIPMDKGDTLHIQRPEDGEAWYVRVVATRP